MSSVTMQLPVSEDFLSSVLITAFDGSYGGCWYWCEPNGKYAWKIENDVWHFVNIIDEDGTWYNVDHDTLLMGIQRIVSGEVGISDDLVVHLIRGLREDDAGEVDADVADCIVQAGIFGKLVYG